MKRNALGRVILYSLLILVLTGILVSAILSEFYLFQFSAGDNVPKEGHVATSDVKRLEIDWVAGSVTIQKANVDHIAFQESAPDGCKYEMEYSCENGTLVISYSKQVFSFSIRSIPSKDLTILVPMDWNCEELSIEGISLDVSIQDLSVDQMELDGISCEMVFSGKLQELQIDGISCNVHLNLPQEWGFRMEEDGISCHLYTALPYSKHRGDFLYGNQGCTIFVDCISCDVHISEATS